MILKVTEVLGRDDMQHNFTNDRLDDFIENHECISKEDWYENEELFIEFKKYCEKRLGKGFFKK